MAPTPAAGKPQSTSSATPKTPTKLSRKPGQTPQKLGQSASKAPPSTPKAASAKKPQTGSPKPSPKTKGVQGAAEGAKNKAQDTAQDVQSQADDSTEDAQSQINLRDDENDEDDGPLSKVSQTGSQAKEGLQEAAPEPIQDSDDDVDDAAEDAEDAADDATENASQAGQSVGKAAGQQKTQQKRPGGGLLKGAQGLAGKASGLAGKAPSKAKDTATSAKNTAGKATQDPSGAAQDVADGAKDTANEAKEGAEDAAEDVQEAGQETLEEGQEAAEGAADEAGDLAEDATEQAGETVNGVKETAEDATDEADDAVDGVEDTAEDAVDGAQDTAEDAVDGVEDTAEDAAEQAGDATDDVQEAAEDATEEAGEAAEGAVDQAEDAADDAAEQAGDATDDVKDAAEDATGQELPEMPEGLPIDLSVLKGLEVQEDGQVLDSEGNPIGRLAEGDAEDLAGYPIGDDGEILDDDGDLVGRVELNPDQIKKQLSEAKEQGVELPEGADEYLSQLEGATGDAVDEAEEATGPSLPGLNILEGLSCGLDGIIYDDEGNTVGRVVEGDPEELQNATLNEQGEFVDEEGNVVGRAEIHDDAAELVEQGIYEAADAADDAQDAAEDAQDAAEDAAEQAEGAAEDAEEAAEGIEDQLPGIEALEGRELNEAGEIVDEEGDVLGQIEDEELRQKIADGEIDPATLQINEEGEVVDEEGNVLGKTELAEGAAEKLAQGGPLLDPRILEGRKVNKKGKILDEDGEEIGELRDGELKDCAGKKVNEKGEVVDKNGNVLGHVSVVSGEAAENATRELLEELGELEPEAPQEPEVSRPDLSILEGYKVNKKGQILNEDGEPVGELVEGELADCAGKKVNDQGEVLDKEGNVIGRVQTLPEQAAEEEQGEQEEEQGEDAEEEEDGDELPPLSILEGLTVNKAGKILDKDGNIVGELVEGDPKKLSKSGTTCDAEGQFWDNKGHVIGRAQTVPREDAEEEAPFAGLEGLHVVQDGYVQDENGHTVGVVTEGDAKRLVGRVVDEDGDILDKKGSVVGHAERYEEEEPEEEPEAEAADLSFLQGKTVNKAGLVIGDEGVPVARLVEGKPKEVAGRKLDGQGQLWNDKGQVIGRVELIPEEEREAKAEGAFAGLEGLRVIDGGKVADVDGNVVGEITEGNAKRLVGLAVDEDGDILDKYGNVKGHAEPLPEEEDEEEVDNSLLDGKKLNKQGYVVDDEGVPFGRLIEGNVSELAGRRCDENGNIYNDTGKVVGRCEVIPENERVHRPEGPFAGLEGLRVVKEGKVEDEDGNVVGEIVEGNAKRLVGMAVDEDGDILDKFGNVKGHAEPYEEPEEEEPEAEDLSALAGTTINKSGNAVNGNGQIIGRVVEGEVKSMIGKKVDGQGQIWDNAGNVVGRCELVHGEDTSADGPFAGFEGLQIKKDGTVVTASGDVVGRIIEGDIKKLMGHTVDEDGDIVDKNGNTIGKAERYEEEEKERRVNPMSGMRVNKEGEVRDDNGDLVGRLTQGDLGHCVGQEIDDSGNVVDVDGNKIGEVTILENIAEDEYEGPTEEELEEAKKREDERQIAEKMSGICTQTLERIQPVCKQIKEHMETADRTPKEELDEEDLVNKVKPLIEEGGRILQECNSSLRGLDPDGKIAAQAKGRAGTGEATPEEYRLAETLKELTTNVVTTIDDAKKKLQSMPHAKKKLNPLWALMTQPLFQILAAVGLLLAGVLGLVGQLLSTLGLGGLVNGLLGGLGIDKLLSGFGLGGGDKKKKDGKSGKDALSSLPVIGGILGGK